MDLLAYLGRLAWLLLGSSVAVLAATPWVAESILRLPEGLLALHLSYAASGYLVGQAFRSRSP